MTEPDAKPIPSGRGAGGRALVIRERIADPKSVATLTQAGFDPILARVLAGRGIDTADRVSEELSGLLAPDSMANLSNAAKIIGQAIENCEPICVVGDYDCDGATATAVTVLGMRKLGAIIDYLVPNRFAHGYGLSAPVVEDSLTHPRLGKPRWIITVDNGVASIDGVSKANEHGIGVIVTDHHLPGNELPAAHAIVNPNVAGCEFPSKNLAGVGVAFYLVAAVRAYQRESGQLADPPPRLTDLLDLVALGTVADVVVLDDNNRRLVRAGMRQMRSGNANAGIRALLNVAGANTQRLTVRDLGFGLGPRINAAGRLDDISIGVECLLSRNDDKAADLAQTLDQINRERREIEADMRDIAMTDLPEPLPSQMSIAMTHDQWHEGVIGLVAGRLRERHHRPIVAFAPSTNDASSLRGSGRSVPGVHLRDVFALIDANHPKLITRFGGHAMAAGLSLPVENFKQFAQALEKAVAQLALPAAFERELLVDGPLEPEQINLSLCQSLDEHIWGQGFMPPVFCNEFELIRQRVVGSGHMKLDLKMGKRKLSAIWFGRDQPLPPRPQLAYRVELNEFRGLLEPQLVVQACANG